MNSDYMDHSLSPACPPYLSIPELQKDFVYPAADSRWTLRWEIIENLSYSPLRASFGKISHMSTVPSTVRCHGPCGDVNPVATERKTKQSLSTSYRLQGSSCFQRPKN
ncbi:hypothetical protein Ae201684P_019889 [Aphanomyces euteiches]|uniref:Uncharacterized protein n=1 Tax=Aphanomyces euteiches TaxID=100861 RepID=A0A6G0WBH2_9STRA|nr:hypothetical protein Ae201684_017023 [Aphanomyces euteiches]KAH9078819.1 hypothetical protein Ae201684P_019889 [Aphanomyces euteiches]